MLGRVRKFLPRNQLVMVYNAIVQPHFHYASCVWSNTYAKYTGPLVALQARAGRVILGAPKLTPTAQVLHDLNWTPMTARWQCQRAVMMYKVAGGLAPRYLTDCFTPLQETYSEGVRGTRGRSYRNYRPCSSGNNWGKRRFASHGAYLWNDLPPEIKSLEFARYKSAIRSLGKCNFKFYSPI